MIATVVPKAVRAGGPRTRYVAGAFAKPMIFIRKWFGDRLFDRVITSQAKRSPREGPGSSRRSGIRG